MNNGCGHNTTQITETKNRVSLMAKAESWRVQRSETSVLVAGQLALLDAETANKTSRPRTILDDMLLDTNMHLHMLPSGTNIGSFHIVTSKNHGKISTQNAQSILLQHIQPDPLVICQLDNERARVSFKLHGTKWNEDAQ